MYGSFSLAPAAIKMMSASTAVTTQKMTGRRVAMKDEWVQYRSQQYHSS